MKSLGEFKILTLREAADNVIGDTAEKIAEYWRKEIPAASWFDSQKESLVVVLLNTRRRILGFNLVSLGYLDTIIVHPREVMRPVIIAAASAFILIHNHPSGDPTPSKADIKVTRDIYRAGQLMKIDCLDHLIMGAVSPERTKDYVSLREAGYFFES